MVLPSALYHNIINTVSERSYSGQRVHHFIIDVMEVFRYCLFEF
jgi:hypothetical protein